MRTPRYLSYSSFALWEKDREEFYLRYLAARRPPSLPQVPAMAIGSAFDARVKSALHAAIFGQGADPQFEFDAIFHEQVEPLNRDWARENGEYVFQCYRRTGAYDELLGLLQQSVEAPRFEFKVEGRIGGEVPFLGKPDCRFVLDLSEGPVHVILDWKVKGYCSKYGASPSKGYALCRDGYEVPAHKKHSLSHGKEHSNYLACQHRGFTVNTGCMEACNKEYADQLTTYGWLLGEQIGDESVVLAIDEVVSKFAGEGAKPMLRVANHRARVTRDYQLKLFERIKACWSTITSGHIFSDMPRQDSDSRCEILEQMSVGLASDGSPQEEWFNEITRPQVKR